MCTEIPEIYLNKHWLINDVQKVVNDSLTGLVKCNSNLAMLDIGNVVVQRDHLSIEKVKIVSGGASGHEPAFGGFVGRGMLTASVQGGIYSSPTPNLILQTIKELARRHENGILIIIRNVLSDRLAFGLAAERAKNIPNLRIRLLKVDDYIQPGEKRGLTGTIIIQKIAGAMSEANLFLQDIYVFCQEVLENMSTGLVALTSAVSPVYEISSCSKSLEPKEMSFGAGIHGHAGYLKIGLMSCHSTVELLLQHMTSSPRLAGTITLDPLIPVILLVNNLGNSCKIEELIFLNEVVTQLQAKQIIIERVYCNSFLTSLDMCGFSLTILNVKNLDIINYLNAPCEAPFWKSFTQLVLDPETSVTISTILEPDEIQLKPNRGPRLADNTAVAIQNAINFACGALISCEKQLNIMDSESGDADTGTNLFYPAMKIIDYLAKNKMRINWPFMLFEELSRVLECHGQGLQPCMYSIMFEAAARPFLALEESDFVTPELWLKCIEYACEAIKSHGKISLGQCTMYDAIHASKEKISENMVIYMANKKNKHYEMTLLDIIGLGALAAEDAAQKTKRPNMDYADPGAHAVGIWMRAVYEGLKLHAHLFVNEPPAGHVLHSVMFP